MAGVGALTQYWMTGGLPTWVPLWSGLAGVMAGFTARRVMGKFTMSKKRTRRGVELHVCLDVKYPAWWRKIQLSQDLQAAPSSGRITAELILLQSNVEAAERIYEIFRAQLNQIDRYCPPCAFLTVLVRHDEKMRVQTLAMELAFEATRSPDEAEYEAAHREFFLDVADDVDGGDKPGA